MKHELKISPLFYDDVRDGKKTFEVRKNDRDFRVGDTLELWEFIDKHGRTGRKCEVEVIYIFSSIGFGLEPGYCIMGVVNIGL